MEYLIFILFVKLSYNSDKTKFGFMSSTSEEEYVEDEDIYQWRFI